MAKKVTKQFIPRCMFNHELLVAYASGNAECKERTLVEKHLAQCTHCRREVRILEESWWSLDVWQEEPETARQPRLDFADLRQRIAVCEEEKSAWTRFREKTGIRLTHYWNAYQNLPYLRMRPAFAAAMMLGALFLFPWNVEQMTGDVYRKDFATGNSAAGDSYSTRHQPVAYQHGEVQVNTQVEEDFAQALQQSEAAQNEQETGGFGARFDMSGNLKNIHMAGLGFAPSSVLPAQQVDRSLKPSIIESVEYRPSVTDAE